MTKRHKKKPAQLDLLSWERDEVIERFEDVNVRAASMRSRIAKGVAVTLNDAALERKEIAKRMSDWLGESVTANMLNAYASESRSEHSISYLRLLALVTVTQDPRLLQLGSELIGHSVISDRYLPWVEVGQLADKKDEIDRAFDATRRYARKAMR
ncbi:MAG: DNA transposition protein [Rhizobiales bacterium]|nr:DNA transposition protein [Hyphomicrobiales bacterium]